MSKGRPRKRQKRLNTLSESIWYVAKYIQNICIFQYLTSLQGDNLKIAHCALTKAWTQRSEHFKKRALKKIRAQKKRGVIKFMRSKKNSRLKKRGLNANSKRAIS